MPSDPPSPGKMWRFHQAPLELRQLFPEAEGNDWLAHLPESKRLALEPMLLRWHDVYPLRRIELPDQSVVYCGAPRKAFEFLPKELYSVTIPALSREERRGALRVQLVLPCRYETDAEPQQVGMGHTIDMSDAGIAFTTESLLPINAKLTLRLKWPVRLPGDVPIELLAVGKLARSEALKAALRLNTVSFDIAR
jgi:hypothetical protein